MVTTNSSIIRYFFYSLLCCFAFACKKDVLQPPVLKQPQIENLFQYIDPSISGVDFNNQIRDTQDFQIFDYEYAYNGGGVAIGDINNDNLPDLYFSGSFVGNKLYLNQGNLKFKDITAQAGVDGGLGYKTGVSMVDINNDGFLDIYVCKSGDFGSDSLRTNLLYINKGNLTFEEKAEYYGLNDKSFSTQAYFSDIDIDGDVDMFLVNHPIGWGQQNRLNLKQDINGKLTPVEDTSRYQVSNRLYINQNEKFTDKTIPFGVGNKAFGLSAVIADFNNDNYPDIYVGNDYIKPDFFYINRGGKFFEDKVNDYFSNLTMSSMGSDAVDLNGDNEFDLFVNDMMPEDYKRFKENRNLIKNYDSHVLGKKYNYHDQFRYNAMHIKNEFGHFDNHAFYTGTSCTDWSWAVLGEDYDLNGYNDLFITNGYLKDVVNMDYEKHTLDSMRRFFKEEEMYPEWKKRVPEAKLRNYFFANNGNMQFDNTSAVWCDGRKSFSNGASYSDLDNDGDLDIVVNNINDAAFIMKNNISETNKNLSYVNIKLKSNSKNSSAYGAELTALLSSGKEIKKLFNPFRGYMSSVDQRCYFGSKEKITNITVKWPGGQMERFNIDKNGEVTLIQGQGTKAETKKTLTTPVFHKIPTDVVCAENEYIDFKGEPLLHLKNSVEGPTMAVADFDGDGNDDVYIGGAANQSRGVYKLTSSKLTKLTNPAFESDIAFEDVASAILDYDKDGDKDLILASGGYQYDENSIQYAIRLYNNDGKGVFTRDKIALPEYKTNALSLTVFDFDNDGDEDVFVGGGALPNNYPLADKSFLLLNNQGKFQVKEDVLPNNGKLSIVKDCIAEDINGDKKIDLVIAGDYSPITILINTGSNFKDETEVFGLSKSNGLWQDLLIADINNDGKKDIIAGNLGTNSFLRAGSDKPLTVYFGDLDKNGENEAVTCQYFNEGLYPIHSLDKILTQCTKLRKKFLRYGQFSHADIEDIFENDQLKKAKMFYAYTLESSIFINKGKSFERQALPIQSQLSMTKDMLTFNNNNKTYLVTAGNFWDTDFEYGKYDASHGAVYIIDVKGNLSYVPNSGFDANNNVRELRNLKSKNGPLTIIVGNNNAAVELFKL